MAEGPDGVLSLFERLGSTSRVLTEAEKYATFRAVAGLQSLMWRRWNLLLAVALETGLPVLHCYMSDGWACDLTKCRSLQTEAGRSSLVGRFRAEFLAEKAILKIPNGDGSIDKAIRILPPRSMESKTGWDVFAAANELPFLRLSLPSHIIVSWHVQDGLHFGSMLRRQQSRHELFYDMQDDATDPAAAARRAKDWVVGLRCVLHCTSSAVKWGFSSFSSEQILDDLHLSIKSLNNTSEALHSAVPEFVLRYVGYQDAPQGQDDRRQLWTCLGVPAPLLDWILRVDPRWDPASSKLWVSSQLDGAAGGPELIQDVVLWCLRWMNFVDTRWAGIGPSARQLLLSLCVGVEQLVKLVDANAKGNDRYYLSAAKTRLSPAVKKLAAVAALSSYPLEGMCLALLEDDRFLLHAQALWCDAGEEVGWVSDLPVSVYEALSVIVGDASWSSWQAKSDVLSAMRTSMSYVHRESFALLQEWPLRATQGDAKARVAELAGVAQAPPDLISQKLHFCSRFYPAETVVALELMREAPCSTALVEKGHSAAAFVRRAHHLVGSQTLSFSAFLSEARVLLRPTRLAAFSMQRNLGDLLSKARAVRYTARNAFCGLAISSAVAGQAGSFDAQERKRLATQCVKEHNSRFDDLAEDQKLALENLAARVRRERAAALFEEAKHAHSAAVLEARRAQSFSLKYGSRGLPFPAEGLAAMAARIITTPTVTARVLSFPCAPVGRVGSAVARGVV